MKFLIVLSLTVVGALSSTMCEAGISALRALPALDHEEVHDEFGQYVLRYVTAEGTVFTERGRLVPTLDGTDCVMVIDGEVTFIGDDDEIYTSKFNAGLDGYHVEGNHLLQPPHSGRVIA